MRFAAGSGACSALLFTLKFILGANSKSRAIYITRVANYPSPLTEKLSAKKKNWFSIETQSDSSNSNEEKINNSSSSRRHSDIKIKKFS